MVMINRRNDSPPVTFADNKLWIATCPSTTVALLSTYLVPREIGKTGAPGTVYLRLPGKKTALPRDYLVGNGTAETWKPEPEIKTFRETKADGPLKLACYKVNETPVGHGFCWSFIGADRLAAVRLANNDFGFLFQNNHNANLASVFFEQMRIVLGIQWRPIKEMSQVYAGLYAILGDDFHELGKKQPSSPSPTAPPSIPADPLPPSDPSPPRHPDRQSP